MKKGILAAAFSIALSITVMAAPDSSKHVVKKGETLYSISRNYNVKFKDLLKVNPGLNSESHIKPGQKINIPGKGAVASADINTKSSNQKPKNTVAVPSTPETPYKEEDNKVRTTESVTAEANNNSVVNANQPVINSTASTTSYSVRTTANSSNEYPSVFNQYAAHGLKVTHVRGAANFLADNTSGNPYLALFNNAETGSVIKVTNMMNKKTVYVKVVGRVPATDASKEVILKLSNKVAQELGARDDKFLVEVASVQSN